MSARSVSLASMFTWIGDCFRLLGRHFLTLIYASHHFVRKSMLGDDASSPVEDNDSIVQA